MAQGKSRWLLIHGDRSAMCFCLYCTLYVHIHAEFSIQLEPGWKSSIDHSFYVLICIVYSNTTAKKNRRHYIINPSSSSYSILMYSKVLCYIAFVYPTPRCNNAERSKQNIDEIDSNQTDEEHKSNENLYSYGMCLCLCLYLMQSAMRIIYISMKECINLR